MAPISDGVRSSEPLMAVIAIDWFAAALLVARVSVRGRPRRSDLDNVHGGRPPRSCSESGGGTGEVHLLMVVGKLTLPFSVELCSAAQAPR
eukprot:3829774-Pyramimonas_sp.AAC.1